MLNLSVENALFDQGYRAVGGLDEAGRGPLAGPVVAACVILPPGFRVSDRLAKVDDSKKLSGKKREELFEAIMEEISGIGVGICDHLTIDRINILQASFLAMKKAIGALKEKPDFLVLDGKLPIPNMSLGQKTIIGGDSRVFSIAAASIIAKVTRDRIMLKLHETFPDYGFDRHKGYGTKLHLERLERFGPCTIHRRSFAPVTRLSC